MGLDHPPTVVVNDESPHIVIALKQTIQGYGHMGWHCSGLVNEEDSSRAYDLGVAVSVKNFVAVCVLFYALGHGLLYHALLEADVVLGRLGVDIDGLFTKEDAGVHVSPAIDLENRPLEKVFAHIVNALVLSALCWTSEPNDVAEVVLKNLGDVIGNLRGMVGMPSLVCGGDALGGDCQNLRGGKARVTRHEARDFVI